VRGVDIGHGIQQRAPGIRFEELFVNRPIARFTVRDGQPHVIGEIDMSNADELERWLDSFGPVPLRVDMSDVTFFDSSALRACIRAARRNRRLRIVQPSARVVNVMKMTETYRELTNADVGVVSVPVSWYVEADLSVS
jgi:anti-anti-sigma factor